MLLESDGMRQYYIRKAEESPLVREAVAGTKTLTGCLEDIISGLREKGELSNAKKTTPLGEFVVFIDTLSVLSGGELWVKRGLWGSLYDAGFFHSGKFTREVLWLFECLYNVSAVVDKEIGRCFILEHFANARPRFEQTYRTLWPGERKAVNDKLHRYLCAGGMPGMDEQQLKWYLGGLLAGLTPGS